jgi:hypothetical protein
MNANELASRVAHHMLAAEGTGPAWGVTIDEVREDYARVSMVVRAGDGRTVAEFTGYSRTLGGAVVEI